MATKTWMVAFEEGNYVVKLEHGYFSGKRIITVDDEIVERVDRNLVDYGSKHYFTIEEHSCIVTIKVKGLIFKYDLGVDGISQETGLVVEKDIETDTLESNKDSWLGILGFITYTVVNRRKRKTQHTWANPVEFDKIKIPLILKG